MEASDPPVAFLLPEIQIHSHHPRSRRDEMQLQMTIIDYHRCGPCVI
jgi:hypothetical protein